MASHLLCDLKIINLNLLKVERKYKSNPDFLHTLQINLSVIFCAICLLIFISFLHVSVYAVQHGSH